MWTFVETSHRGMQSVHQPFTSWDSAPHLQAGSFFIRHCWTAGCVKKLKGGMFQYFGLVCNLFLLSLGVQHAQFGLSLDQTDVILAEVSPSSQSCGLVHVWGGGWEGPLTATPPCLPAPHRSRSPGRGSKGQAEELIVIFSKETKHAFWMRELFQSEVLKVGQYLAK